GIYVLTKKADDYLVGYQKSEKLYSKKELEVLYKEKLSKGYIMQKYIASKSKQGDPFDCRVHYEKNGKGKWEIAKMYIRIGIGQKVISNMNQGGGMSAPKKYLEVNFGENGKKI